MRFLLFAVLLTLLAGCSGGGGLSDHVVLRGDLDDGFAYWKIPAEAREQGLDRNPGPFDTSDFREFGAASGYLSAFSYNGSEEPILVSQAIRFTNETARDTFVTQFSSCSEDAFVIESGLIVTQVQFLAVFAEDDDAEFLREQAHDAAHAIEVRTGGTSPCDH